MDSNELFTIDKKGSINEGDSSLDSFKGEIGIKIGNINGQLKSYSRGNKEYEETSKDNIEKRQQLKTHKTENNVTQPKSCFKGDGRKRSADTELVIIGHKLLHYWT